MNLPSTIESFLENAEPAVFHEHYITFYHPSKIEARQPGADVIEFLKPTEDRDFYWNEDYIVIGHNYVDDYIYVDLSTDGYPVRELRIDMEEDNPVTEETITARWEQFTDCVERIRGFEEQRKKLGTEYIVSAEMTRFLEDSAEVSVTEAEIVEWRELFDEEIPRNSYWDFFLNTPDEDTPDTSIVNADNTYVYSDGIQEVPSASGRSSSPTPTFKQHFVNSEAALLDFLAATERVAFGDNYIDFYQPDEIKSSGSIVENWLQHVEDVEKEDGLTINSRVIGEGTSGFLDYHLYVNMDSPALSIHAAMGGDDSPGLQSIADTCVDFMEYVTEINRLNTDRELSKKERNEVILKLLKKVDMNSKQIVELFWQDFLDVDMDNPEAAGGTSLWDKIKSWF